MTETPLADRLREHLLVTELEEQFEKDLRCSCYYRPNGATRRQCENAATLSVTYSCPYNNVRTAPMCSKHLVVLLKGGLHCTGAPCRRQGRPYHYCVYQDHTEL